MSSEDDKKFMTEALILAKKAFDENEVPVGAVLVSNGVIVARAYNKVEQLCDATAHAELLCIRQLSQELKNWRLLNTTLYTTLEPCAMCAGALLLSRVTRVVWAAPDNRHGACGSWVNLLEKKHPTHTLLVEGGLFEEQAALLMKNFFQRRRFENDRNV